MKRTGILALVILAIVSLRITLASDATTLYLPLIVVGNGSGPDAPTATPSDFPTAIIITPSSTSTETPPTATPTNTATNEATNTPTSTDEPTDEPTNTPTHTPTNTSTPTDEPTDEPTNEPTETPSNTPTPSGECDECYTNVCIPPNIPDMNCPEIREKYGCDITVICHPDPHKIDRDGDGIGCECN